MGPCYWQTRHSINILRSVIIIYALTTWFYLVLLAFFLLAAGPAYCEVITLLHFSDRYNKK